MLLLDNRILRRVHHFDVRAFIALSHSHWRVQTIRLARSISFTADGWLYPLTPLVLLLLSAESVQIAATALAVGFLIERCAYLVIKKGLKRRRPPVAIPGFESEIVASDEFSFPSGHTSGAFLLSTTLFLLYGPIALPLYLWAAMVGCSRVILGVHFPTDILAGACLGSAVAWLMTTSLLVHGV